MSSPLEQVTGWLVGGKFFEQKTDAETAQRQLEFAEWCEFKFGKNGRSVARQVWEKYEIKERKAQT